MIKTGKIVIFGDSDFGEIAYEYFTHDSPYEVVAFTVNREYLHRTEFFGLPVVAFEDVETIYPPSQFAMHIALVFNKLNRIRRRVYNEAREKGYTLANYVSSKAFVWHNVTIGDNVFIFEDNTIQPFVRIGSNNVLWSGNHIGHHSSVGSHNFISSHVVISGGVNVGDGCFLGVNSTIINDINIGNDCLIGAGALIAKTIPDGSYVKGPAAVPERRTTYEKFSLTKS